MPAVYPATLWSGHTAPATLAGPPTHEAMHETVSEELVATQTELGTNPSGASATVAARFNLLLLKAGDTMTGALYTTAVRGFGTTGAQLQAVSPTADKTAYMALYANGTDINTPGTRSGYVGHAGTNDVQVVAEAAGSDVALVAPTAAKFTVGGSETARVNATHLLVGKTTSAIGTTGAEAAETGTLWSTVDVDQTNVAINKTGAAVASGATFESFLLSGAAIGSITRNAATSAVLYNTTSDERLKTDVGIQVDDGLGVIERVNVRRFTRDGSDASTVGVFAQELVKVVPSAVTPGGDDPQADPWQVAYGSDEMVSQLILAVQQLSGRVRDLETQLAAR